MIQYAYDHGFVDYNSALCLAPDNGDLTQLLKAIFGIINSKFLLVPLTLYVNDATGNDANTGYTALVPFKTIQRAFDIAGRYSPSSNNIAINVADGNYAGAAAKPWAQPVIILTGNISNPGNVVITGFTNVGTSPGVSGLAISGNGLQVNIRGFTIQTSGTLGAPALYVTTSANVFIEKCVLGNSKGSLGSTWYCITADTAAYIVVGDFTYAGQGAGCFLAQGSSTISFKASTCTCATVIAMFTAFAVAQNGGQIISYGSGFVNPSNVTGQRYAVSVNGVIYTQGSGANYFPGNVAGAVVTGGQYI